MDLQISLGNLAVSQPSCNIRVVWQLGTERVPQLNDSRELCSKISPKFLPPFHSNEKRSAHLLLLTSVDSNVLLNVLLMCEC
ncbi:hypothetical protein T265_05850 [Opisthorchis viverrini]|uniref:Uncharacterized protein n=1 Tax=Opisthorchis viverrini TaxID=6198 RepID=A0A074ZI70_OPIVI|nr:hypothetical protein T265_05850 [Opisthorchis viverrini]KER27018.1 hypothetical protein T265_05850 [Opisthorchis viverrini]